MNLIGLSSFVLAAPFTEESLPLLKDARTYGYDLVEVSIADLGSIDPQRLKAAARDCGLALRIAGDFGPERNISSDDARVRSTGLDYLLGCLEFAAAAGADVVAGPMYSAVGSHGLLDPAARRQRLAWAAENLAIAADRAATLDLRLALEPLNRFENNLINTVDQGLELCDAVGSGRVGLALDTFHMNIEEKGMATAIRAAGPRIFSFQASENDRGTPGSGHVPWPAVFGALRAADYAGPVIVESFRSDSIPLVNALALWRPVAESMEELARQSLDFVRDQLRRSDRASTADHVSEKE
ncbi:tagatose 3-epimerase [Microlunatus endophyticus]|uniref:Tagatose 3-epimerase n=1 Tax=Microlunatus endophyticus TaxID=1716077 RepID=A0A917SDR5_9ACTN|nr:sugar phosphate isomerase/epimerase family protein [Microlunatus endophyticus]GGL72924.1 tagatose 3-epimerase [Microlunatus endophyticus]